MHHRSSFVRRSRLSFCTLGLVTLLSACTQIKPLKPELTLQVQPAGSDGYTVSGTTNLPDQPRVLVQAIRKLNPNNETGKRPATYVIVAQQWVDTQEGGSWQATLKLRQAGVNGGQIESWQQHPTEMITTSTAEQQVTFVASTSPISPDLRLEGDTTATTNANLQSEAVQVATDGSRYLKAKQSLMIPPPQVTQPTTVKFDRQPVAIKTSPANEAGDPRKQEKTDAVLGQDSYTR
jgi:hypothetical protein